MSTSFYQTNASGLLTNIVTQTGQPDNPVTPTNVVNGIQTDESLNSWGQTISVMSRYITSGIVSTILSHQTFTPRQQNLWLESGSGSFPKL